MIFRVEEFAEFLSPIATAADMNTEHAFLGSTGDSEWMPLLHVSSCCAAKDHTSFGETS